MSQSEAIMAYFPGYETTERDADRLEAELTAALGWLGCVSRTTKECLRQDLRLERDFPGQFVAFVDHWHKAADGTHFLVREVIDAASTRQALTNRIAGLSATMQRRVQIKFVKDPSSGIEPRCEFVAE